jgi:hypothetical protein
MEREKMIVLVSLSERTVGRRERERELQERIMLKHNASVT